LSERRRPIGLEHIAAIEMAVVLEVVVDGYMKCGKFLQRLKAS
jgi:hypothetical protein